jgi:ATP-binding cassette subfamily F protein uup
MKGKLISASQLLERFLFDAKIWFCRSIERWWIETFVFVYGFDSESELLDSGWADNDLDIVTLNVLESFFWIILDVF